MKSFIALFFQALNLQQLLHPDMEQPAASPGGKLYRYTARGVFRGGNKSWRYIIQISGQWRIRGGGVRP